MQQKFTGPRVQDIVYNLDVGIGLQIFRVALYVLVVLLIMLFYTANQFHGLDNRDAMDYAQLGRNLSLGRGYVTRNLSPATIGYLHYTHPSHDHRITNHPEMYRAPAYPFALSLGFRIFRGAVTSPPDERGVYSPEQWVVVPMNHIFVLLTGLLVFLFGLRLFGRLQAVLAASVYFLSNAAWALSISGRGVTMAVFFVLASLYAMLLASDVREKGGSFIKWFIIFLISAGCAVVAILTRYGAMFALIPMAVFLICMRFGSRGWAWSLLFVVLCVVGIAPWLARNFLVSGRLFGIAPYMMLNDADDNLLRTLGTTFQLRDLFSRAAVSGFMTRIARFYSREIWGLGGGLLGAFFISSFFYRFARKDVGQFRWMAAIGIFMSLIMAGVYGDSALDLMHIFYPVGILYGLAFFFLLFKRLQLQYRILELALITLAVLLSALPLIFTLLPPRATVPYPPYHPVPPARISALFNEHELLCTDMPWATAWYGDQTSVLLPVDVDEYYELNDFIYRVGGIYFTTLTRDKPYALTLLTGPYRSWFPIMHGQLPGDFPLTHGMNLNDFYQFILTDYPRWE